jgi:hypothetical protein
MSRPPFDLTPEQRDEADRIERLLLAAVGDEVRGIAELLASKPDAQLLGAAEFQVRDRVHKIGAKAIQAALDERKRGGTRAPAPDTRPATAPASSSTDATGPSSA